MLSTLTVTSYGSSYPVPTRSCHFYLGDGGATVVSVRGRETLSASITILLDYHIDRELDSAGRSCSPLHGVGKQIETI